MRMLLGPTLYIGRCDQSFWRFHVNVLIEGGRLEDGPPIEVWSRDRGVEVRAPVLAADFTELADAISWRWLVAVSRDETERWVGYTVEAKPRLEIEGLDEPRTVDGVAIPAKGALPRMAFFTCNGVSSGGYSSRVSDLHALWKRLDQFHEEGQEKDQKPERIGSYHLLIGGGDQIYADHLWNELPELDEFSRKSPREKESARPSDGFFRQVFQGYVRMYVAHMGVTPVAKVMARVPGLYTWDDHDIFDNWGSYGDEIHESPYFQQIYKAAARTYEAFQLGGEGRPLHVGGDHHYLQAVSFHELLYELDIVCLDLRSGRRLKKVMSSGQHFDLGKWLEAHAERSGPRRHLLIVSSIPFVYMKFDSVDQLLDKLPTDVDIHGDLRDQWEHPQHRKERDQLLMQLLEHGRKAACRISIITGDVHLGGRARIVSTRPEHQLPGQVEAVIEQMISSGIVHPAPSFTESSMVELIGDEAPETVEPGVTVGLVRATERSRYLWVRNWLSMVFDEPVPGWPEDFHGRLWMRLIAEKGEQPQVVVEPGFLTEVPSQVRGSATRIS